MTAAVVVIGRNEGERLKRCLNSIVGAGGTVIYVDSDSTDGSVELAERLGASVVRLDMSRPFTAARARNEGFRRLRECDPGVAHVQFVDGDCEVSAGWIGAASAFLDTRPDVAAVCGRLREMHPERSIYNLLCDVEWEKPVGEVAACGGNVMMRAGAFAAAGGFRDDMIAGEEPELCLRLRTAGWRIWCIDADMARHDAAMTRFGQWWRRTLRGGYACALGASLHGATPERYRVRESRRIWLWGLVLPLAILVVSAAAGPWALLMALAYPLQVARLAVRGSRSTRENWLRAFFLVFGKLPEMLGQLKFAISDRSGRPTRLIEYK